jgi:hypothetical protein
MYCYVHDVLCAQLLLRAKTSPETATAALLSILHMAGPSEEARNLNNKLFNRPRDSDISQPASFYALCSFSVCRRRGPPGLRSRKFLPRVTVTASGKAALQWPPARSRRKLPTVRRLLVLELPRRSPARGRLGACQLPLGEWPAPSGREHWQPGRVPVAASLRTACQWPTAA